MAKLPPLKVPACSMTGTELSIEEALRTLPISLFGAIINDRIGREDVNAYFEHMLLDPSFKEHFEKPLPEGTTAAIARTMAWPSTVSPLSMSGALSIIQEYFRSFGRGGIQELALSAVGDAMAKFPHFHPNPIPGRGRTVGLEIESNPTPATTLHVLCNWLAAPTVDHSLRGNYAIEFRSPVLRESTFPQWVDKILNPKTWNSKIYSRCGQHLWVGVDDFSWFDLAQFVKYCWIYRYYFYSLVPPSRWPSPEFNASGAPQEIRPPRSWNSIMTSKVDILKWLYGASGNELWARNHGLRGQMSAMRADKRANDRNEKNYPRGVVSRYWWLNVHGYFGRRAIEIRLHQATNNPEKVIRWAQLWCRIADFVASAPKNMFSQHPSDVIGEELNKYFKGRQRVLFNLAKEEADAGRLIIPRWLSQAVKLPEDYSVARKVDYEQPEARPFFRRVRDVHTTTQRIVQEMRNINFTTAQTGLYEQIAMAQDARRTIPEPDPAFLAPLRDQAPGRMAEPVPDEVL